MRPAAPPGRRGARSSCTAPAGCANHDGNVTRARWQPLRRDADRDRQAARSPSSDLIEVDGKGQVVGAGKVFGEIGLHLVVYERRPDVGCGRPRAPAVRDRDRRASRKQPDRAPVHRRGAGLARPADPEAAVRAARRRREGRARAVVRAGRRGDPRQPRRDRVGQGLRAGAAAARARRAPREDRGRSGSRSAASSRCPRARSSRCSPRARRPASAAPPIAPRYQRAAAAAARRRSRSSPARRRRTHRSRRSARGKPREPEDLAQVVREEIVRALRVTPSRGARTQRHARRAPPVARRLRDRRR